MSGRALGKLDRLPCDDQQPAPRSGTHQRDSVPCLTAVKRVDEQLRRHLEIPTWEEFAEGTQTEDDEALELGLSRHGWQKTAHKCFENRVACTGQLRQSHVKIPTRAPRGHSLRVRPFESVFQVRPAVVQVAPSTLPPSSHSIVFQILQVWPPTRPTWPPPRGMLRSSSFGETRIPFWKGQQHKCAVKLEEGLLRTSWSKTWTWQCSTTSTAAG